MSLKRIDPGAHGQCATGAFGEIADGEHFEDTADSTKTEPLRLDLIGSDRCAFDIGGERVVIENARGPLCAAARAAIMRGVDARRPIEVFRDGRPALTVRGSVGALARVAVREDARSAPRLVEWRPFDGGDA